MYVLVDCNNFFVSCERVFQPELEGVPVVVLSNNDGCVVARSNESKDLGVKMCLPFFKIRALVEAGGLIVRSSNYELYADMSSRVMSLLAEETSRLMVYSIDEAYLLMEGLSGDKLMRKCRDIIIKIRQQVGIPVSIGVASTKTLAKIANHFAKKYSGYKGICMIDNEIKRKKALELTPIPEVWGIGWRGAPKLQDLQVNTASDFTDRPVEWVEKYMGITGVRTWKELQGINAIEDIQRDKHKTICTSRSFAELVYEQNELEQRISDFASICAQKLRKDGTIASEVHVFIHTNRFREDLPQYYPESVINLEVPASSSQEIISAAIRGLQKIFKSGYGYKRAGVIVSGISDYDSIQASIFDFDSDKRQKEECLSTVMDRLNSSEKDILKLAAQNQNRYSEGIRRDFCSKQYSTSLDDIILIH